MSFCFSVRYFKLRDLLFTYAVIIFVGQILFHKLAWEQQDNSSSVQTQSQARDGVHGDGCSGCSFANVPLRTGTVTKAQPAFKGSAD